MTMRLLALTFLTAAAIGTSAAAQTPAGPQPPRQGQPTQPGQPNQPGQPRQQGQPQPGQPGQPPGQPGQPGQPQAGQPGQPAQPPPGPRPRPENASTNIQVDVTITDSRPGAPSVTKSVMLVTSDGSGGSVRSQSSGAGTFAPFNVDSVPVIMADGRIHTRVTVQYDAMIPATSTERTANTSIRDSVTLVLQSGKPMIVVQSTDPVSDRKVSVEVKATILK